jgi:hypothetical protein
MIGNLDEEKQSKQKKKKNIAPQRFISVMIQPRNKFFSFHSFSPSPSLCPPFSLLCFVFLFHFSLEILECSTIWGHKTSLIFLSSAFLRIKLCLPTAISLRQISFQAQQSLPPHNIEIEGENNKHLTWGSKKKKNQNAERFPVRRGASTNAISQFAVFARIERS